MFFCAPKTTSSILLTKRVKFYPGAKSKSSNFAPSFEKKKGNKRKEAKEN